MPPPSELTHDCSRTSPDERGVGLHLAQGEPTVAVGCPGIPLTRRGSRLPYAPVDFPSGKRGGGWAVTVRISGSHGSDGRYGSLVLFLAVPHHEAEPPRSEEHTSELQSHVNLVCRLLLEK